MEAQGLETKRPSAVEATIKYVVAGEKAVFFASDRAKRYCPVEDHPMRIKEMAP